MRLLLINANTSEVMTERIAAEARRIAAADTTVTGVTARFGARYVATRAAYAVAAHAALDAYAGHGGEADAIVLACFGDPGLFALREVARVPVVGMAEASCRMAARRGKRIAIVTGGSGWVPMLREFVAAIGSANEVAAIRAVAPTGAEIAADPERACAILAAECRAAAAEDGADVVILGGAGLIGIADAIASAVPVPLVDSLTAAVKIAEEVAWASAHATATVEQPAGWVGLSPHLSELLSP
jgi:Asp/Glu/hydantoin racemase